MASYRGHLAFSTVLGAGYGCLAAWHWHLDWGPAILGGGLTALGGMLPDLDSDTSVPVRELFGVAAAACPFLLLRRLESEGLSMDQTLVLMGGMYLVIRYALSMLFKHGTVHRGMLHSIPGMLIAGLAIFLVYRHPNMDIRLYLAGGTMLGFLSHLVLDELSSVDFMGFQVRLNKSAGSALKLYSSSWTATLATYSFLGGMIWLATRELEAAGMSWYGLEEWLRHLF